MSKYLLILFLFCLTPLQIASATPALILEDGKDFYELGLHLEILEDKTGELKLKDIETKFSSKFKRSTKKVPNFGFTKSTFWARFSIKNNTNFQKKWLLSFNFYLQDELSFFKKKNGVWHESKTGDAFPFSEREIKSRPFAFKINPGSHSQYFIRVKGAPSRLNLTIFDSMRFAKEESRNNYIFGLFFGLVLSMIAYNGFIFIATKSVSYLFYILYVFFYGLILSTYSGFTQVYLFGEIPWLNNNGLVFIVGLGEFFFSLFTFTYLKVNKSTPKLYSFMRISCLLGILSILSSFILPYSMAMRLCMLFGFLLTVINVSSGIYKIKLKYRPAKYFVLAFAFMMIGVFILMFMMLGMIPNNLLTRQSSIIGSAIELILLSMGLADRFNLLQEENFKLQKKYSKDLEKKVTEKSHEMELEKLELEMLSNIHYEQKEARDQLLGSLSQGYLAFNREGIIQEGATKVTEDFLNTSLFESEVRGIKIWDSLFKESNKKDNFKQWVDKVFEGRFSFKDLNQLSPKTFQGTKEKYIQLEFRPIYKKGSKSKIDKVIMIASDKTHEIELENQLEKDKENIEFVTKCLQNPLEFVDLIFDSTTLIQEFKLDKQSLGKGELFRQFHTLKARFGQFSLKSLTATINDIETAISEENFDELDSNVEKFDLKLKEFVKNNRLIVEAANKFLVEEGNAVQVPEIIKKAKEFNVNDQFLDFIKNEYLLSDLKTKFERYIPLVDEMAERQGKSINFQISGDKVLVDTNKYSDFINTSIHLFRNMVDHGIESEDERIEKTKPQQGNIKVNFKLNGGDFEIILQDDGQGINPDKVKEKAIAKRLKSEEELSQIKNKEIVDMIFLPGLSTKEEVTEFSGRGIGMNAVRDEIKKLKGKISESSKVDEGTIFTIKLPILS